MAEIKINADISGAINNLNKVDDSLKDISKSYDDLNKASGKAFDNQEKGAKETIGYIEDIENAIKDWEEARKKATNVKDIEKYNNKIQEGRKHLQEYQTMGLPAMKKVNAEASQGEKIFARLGGMIAGAFAIDRLVSFGKEILQVTAKFQKMEAVLTTSLGSQSAANAAMNNIVEFASKTPFQVDELTDSFVKLANRGFVPTIDEMKSLGDLASSTGKSFDQLTEAMLDAQTGEFERLKEFGIRAKANGDQVAFTFKGVTTEVEKTDDAIKDYIISLGNAEGVTGSMEDISKTLDGTISNLGDSWDQFLLSLGKTADKNGVVQDAIKGMSDALGDMSEILNSELNTGLEKFLSIWGSLSGVAGTDALVQRNKEIEKGLKNTAKSVALIEDETERHKAFAEMQKFGIEVSIKTGIEKEKIIAILNKEYDAQRKLLKQQQESNDETKKTTDETKKEVGRYEELVALKGELEKILKNEIAINSELALTTAKRLNDINAEIRAIEILADDYQGLDDIKGRVAEIERNPLATKQSGSLNGLSSGGGENKEKTWWQNFLLGDAEYSEEAMKEAEERLISELQDVSNQAMDILAQEVAFKEKMIQREIDAQNNRIDEVARIMEIEADLKKQGLANDYEGQKKQYEKLAAERDKSIREQKKASEEMKKIEQVNQLVGLITSTVNIWKSHSEMGPVGLVLAALGTAALWGSYAYSKSKAQSESMYEHGGSKVLGGKDHNQGGVRIPGLGEAERGEMISIFSKKATRKYGREIENFTKMINKDSLKLDKGMIHNTIIMQRDDSKIDETNRLLRIISERNIEGNSLVIRKGLTTRRINLN